MAKIHLAILMTFLLTIACNAVAQQCDRSDQEKDDKADKPRKNYKPKFTVGKETTYVTGPVDKDGFIDYATALHERMRQGVTPENNANVLIWKAIGPHPQGLTMPAYFFDWLSIAVPPEQGDYFVDLPRYMMEQL